MLKKSESVTFLSRGKRSLQANSFGTCNVDVMLRHHVVLFAYDKTLQFLRGKKCSHPVDTDIRS